MTNSETQSNESESGITASKMETGKFPDGSSVLMASQSESDRFYFRHPAGGIRSTPAMDAEQAKQMLADETPGFGPEDFEQVDSRDAEPVDYPDPAHSDREVNAHDVLMLKSAMKSGPLRRKYSSWRNPTERMLKTILDEWRSPEDVPLDDPAALQQADGIGPSSAARITGAAYSNNLIKRPKQHYKRDE